MARQKKRKGKKFLNKFFHSLGKDYKCWLALFVWAIFVLLLVGYFYLSSLKEYSNVSKNLSRLPLISVNKSVKGWVEIDYSNGKKRFFAGDFHQEFPLALVLNASFNSSKLKLTIKNGTIESIGGVKGRWAIYQNKKLVGLKLNGLTIKGGDKYAIKKEK